jgi:ankyrin repeat protein
MMQQQAPKSLQVNNLETEMTQILLEAGADPSMNPTAENQSRLAGRTGRGPPALLQLLLPYHPRFDYAATTKDNQSCLHEACFFNNPATGHIIIDHDLKHGKKLIFKQNWCNNTPLYDSCKSGNLEMAKRLIEVGGQELMAIRGEEGNSPLDIAREKGHEKIVKVLLLAGAKTASELAREAGSL